ncbi:MAG: DUF1566 domain-containing protein [Candidatus Brocadiaceae bacterium]|nr:DUF1566 domain-containing protein [Candidatus Brocadiaceae bacterium]
MNGCDLIQAPDEDDKMLDCISQGVVFPLVLESIGMAEAIIFNDETSVVLQDTSPGLVQNGNINVSGNAMIGGNLDAIAGVSISGSPVIGANGQWVGSPTGLVGPAGNDGAVGATGPQGDKGDTGDTGAKGDQGDTVQGPQGEPGTSSWVDGFATVSTTGSVQIGSDTADGTADCNADNAGTIRFTGTNFEGCNGTEWVSFTSSGSEDALYAIGDDGPAGGKVFYVTDSGLHGMEAAPADQSTGAAWGCFGSEIAGADGQTIGTGAQNTDDILLAGCQTAADATWTADAYKLNGYDDWYLPSIGDLNLLYQQKTVVGGFANDGYWSSSETSSNYAWYQYFPTSSQSNHGKNGALRVRAVRSF